MTPELQKAQTAVRVALADVSIPDLTKKQALALYKDVGAAAREVYDDIGKQLMHTMQDFAVHEAATATKILDQGTTAEADVTRPDLTALDKSVFQTDLGLHDDVGDMGQAWQDFTDAKVGEIVDTVRSGVIGDALYGEIISSVAQLIQDVQTQHLDAMVRTMTTHASTLATVALSEQNSDIVESLKWVATLDSDTCLECEVHDGEILDSGDSDVPPVHYNCRCVLVPEVKPEYKVEGVETERPAVGQLEAEQVSSDTVYGEWIKDQTAGFQDDVLGPHRAELLRSGGLEIKQFVAKDYSTLTLDQLKSRYPDAWDKAFG